MKRSGLFFSAAVALLLASSSVAARADLLGSSVTLSGACCSSPANITSTTGPVVVGAGIEFLSIPLYQEQFNITGNQIIITTVDSTTPYGSGGFNGFLFSFTGAPPILGVTLDPATTLNPVGYSFTSTGLTVNFAGLNVRPGITTIFDVSTSAATPEPTSLLLLGTGMAGVAAAIRRRRQTA